MSSIPENERCEMENKGNVLVVDDDAGVRDLFRIRLGDDGYRVIAAGDGREGLERIGSEEIELVISDIKIPGLDGIRLLEEVRMKAPELTVVIMTGYASLREGQSVEFEVGQGRKGPCATNVVPQ